MASGIFGFPDDGYERPPEPFEDKALRQQKSNKSCKCGSVAFLINYLPPPIGSGGYLKLTCVNCGRTRKIMDDYS